MLLEYRKVYLIRRAPDGSRFLAIAPRMDRSSPDEPMVQFLVDSDAPGSNAHSILHPSFAREEDGTISVVNTEDDETWLFEELTYDLWKRYIRPVLDEETARYVERARDAGMGVQQFYLEQRLDEEAWPEFP